MFNKILFSKNKNKKEFLKHESEIVPFTLKELSLFIDKENNKKENQDESDKIIINIDQFMEFNIEFGFEYGNQLLKDIKDRIINFYKKIFNCDKYIYLVSVDSLCFYLEEYEKELPLLIDLISEIEDMPYKVGEDNVYIKIRISVSENKYEDFENVMFGIKRAKIEQKNIIFSSEIEKEKQIILKKFEIFKSIKKALNYNQLIPYFQPVVDKHNNIHHYEVLIRIKDNGKLLAPNIFLDIAKDFRIYYKITEEILNKVLEIYQEKNIPFSINIDIEDLENIMFRKQILKIIKKHFQNTNNIQDKFYIEISFSKQMRDENVIINFLESLQKLGVKIILDDFGTEYNNLEYVYKIKHLLWGVKYYKEIVTNIDENPLKETILKNLNSIFKSMDINILVKYVENKEIKDILINNDINYFQGYYCSAPQEITIKKHNKI